MVKNKIEQTRIAVSLALSKGVLQAAAQHFPEAPAQVAAWSLDFWNRKQFSPELESRLQTADLLDPVSHPAYRALLLLNSLWSLDRMESLPVDDAVKLLMCDEYAAFAADDPDWFFFYDPKEYSFRALLGISICQRFRAGLLDWEVAGFPRSWLLKVPRKDFVRTAWHLVVRMKGFKPFWFPHNAFLRGKVQFMREREWEASLLLMAKSMRLQPEIKGILTGSWFYAPETHRVTPHLRWTTRIFLENGAWMTNRGPADPDAGFLQGAKDRQALYEAGKYRPTETILLWPRNRILQWLRNRPVKPSRKT